MSKLVTSEGEILVPGIKELVAPLTDEERKRYDVINFSVKVGDDLIPQLDADDQDIDDAVGASVALSDDKATTVSLAGDSTDSSSWAACATPACLSTVSRAPSVCLLLILLLTSAAPGCKTVIPAAVHGR